jgi:hypothetical protein
MSALKFFDDDLLLEIGRIAALRGSIRLSLLSIGDQLLSTRLGDQGIARLLMWEHELPAICEKLLALAQVRGVPAEATQQLSNCAAEFREDFELAAAIANGTWTYLGGDQHRFYGLFLGEAAHAGDLQPRWREITIEELRGITRRLEKASEALHSLTWVAIAAAGRGKDQKP